VERDQQAAIAAAAERTRIARELHDIVSHSLSVVITLADAAEVVSPAGSVREAVTEISETGRQALSDMRAMLGLLRTDDPPADMAPQPSLAQLGALVERVRATGLDVELDVAGSPFPMGAAAELTAYRIVQEALTNTLRHAEARHARVSIRYDAPRLELGVTDDGQPAAAGERRGHGIHGMHERAALHNGMVQAGPAPDGGWVVTATLRPETVAS
jgi:signal transduction histidine kinase